MKAVGLLSGGLDSTVALRLMQDQGIEMAAFNMVTLFCCCTPKEASCSAARTAVRQLGIDLRVVNATDELLPIVADPRHGHGSGMNPCLDCRILLFTKAREYMNEIGASFVVTGEVLGQRPMSQRRDAMRLIDRESGLEGYVVRPLSAGLLEPTVPEERGWIDREMLLSVSGRSRKPQMALAEELGVNDYPCPAGGCLLTDPIFAERMRDLVDHQGVPSKRDARVLKLGRHFRLSVDAKAIVGRDEHENGQLRSELSDGDVFIEIDGHPGPFTLVTGEAGPDELAVATAIASRYGKSGGRDAAMVRVSRHGTSAYDMAYVGPVDRREIRAMMIGRRDEPNGVRAE